MNKKLIIASPHQFGYHIDTYHYCKYLKVRFSILYICWDQSLPKLVMNGIRVVYIDRSLNPVMRNIQFLISIYNEIIHGETIILVRHFKVLSFLLGLYKPTDSTFLDIRTGSVSKSYFKRKVQDLWLKIVTLQYNKITVISESLASKLKIKHKSYILPLGSDIISKTNKKIENINLLYVGTLYNRNIDMTIKGFKKFLEKFGGNNEIKATYTIIGSGPGQEEKKLSDLVYKLNLQSTVSLVGYVSYTNLKRYFDSSNIGVSFIPLTDYFEIQPPTKTFEYLLAGMPVVATATLENSKVINANNGVLINDTIDGFYNGLKSLFERRAEFNSKQIRDESLKYSWENIIKKRLLPFLNQF